MLFPIGDDDRDLDGPALITWALLLGNLGVYLLQMLDPTFTYGWSVVPYEIMTGEDLTGLQQINIGGQYVDLNHEPGPIPIYLTLISAMFMHGGLMHIGGNMLYLWIFGDNVEHRFGPKNFLLFYLFSGLIGTFTQIALDPDSIIPNLGASGAISGVLGAYLVLFPRNRVHVIFFIRVIALPAIGVIGVWAAFQIINGLGSFAMAEQAGGVAYGAHIGGFIAGAAIALLMRKKSRERDSVITRVAQRDPRSKTLW